MTDESSLLDKCSKFDIDSAKKVLEREGCEITEWNIYEMISFLSRGAGPKYTTTGKIDDKYI